MNLLELPDELLLCIVEAFEFTWDINSLAQVNHRLYNILNPIMYQQDARFFNCSALNWAVEHGNERTVRKFLDENPPQGYNYSEILVTAAAAGHDAVVQVFLEKGVSPTLCGGLDSVRPLLLVVQRGNDAMARALLAHGADVETLKRSDLFFWQTVYAPGILSSIKFLVEEVGCDATEYSARPLLAGALKGKVEILEYLLQLGCDVNGQAYDYKREWKTAVCSTAELGQVDAVRLLIEYGADLDPVLRDGTAMYYPLRLALRHYRRKIAELLLKHMDLTTVSADPERQGVLLCAAAACDLEELAGRLIEHGCNPEAEFPGNGNLVTYSRFGCTASAWAAGSCHTNVLELLLNHGTDSRWPLSAAVNNGQTQVVKLLLAKGADPNRLVLFHAVNHEDTLRLLLENSLHMTQEDLNSMLGQAVCYGKPAVVKNLLNRGAQIESMSNALRVGSQGGMAMVELLFQYGVTASSPESPDGQDAVKLAVDQLNVPLFKFLLDRGYRFSQDDHFHSLSRALSAESPGLVETMLDILLSHGVDINVQKYPDFYNILCVSWNNRRNWLNKSDSHKEFVFKLLLEKGADPLLQDGSRDGISSSPLLSVARSKFATGAKIILEEIGSCERISPKDLKYEIRQALSEIVNREGYGEVGRILQRFYYGELAGMEWASDDQIGLLIGA